MDVTLIGKPNASGDTLCGMAASVCTRSNDIKRSLRGAMGSGHDSVAEHAAYTFYITDVSRVLLAQLTRHRLASYSVESQRYCKAAPDMMCIPDSVVKKGLDKDFLHAVYVAFDCYDMLIEHGVKPEDARYVIPEGTTTSLVLTMNARELRHFFELRCCNRAQWEIREMANKMLAICKQEAPDLFRDAGPGCVRGRCPEGSHSCGHPVGSADHA